MLSALAKALLLTAAVAGLAGAGAQPRLYSRNPALFEQNANDFQTRLLTAHNRHRAVVGSPALRWDERLAASARAYGPRLAATGGLVHSPRAGRPGVAESLWMGPRGDYSLEAMVDAWAAKRRDFLPGVFPYVSRTGNWEDVSHYTQLIWPRTTHVGCALERAGRYDYLICHYSPKGNQDGQRLP
jgi:hypothetical protein